MRHNRICKWLIFVVGLGFPAFAGSLEKGKAGLSFWVSTSPQITELLFQLGHESQITATPVGSDYPEEAKRLKRLGLWLQPNLESLLATRAHGILWDENSFEPNLAQRLETEGFRSVQLELSSVESLWKSAKQLLSLFHAESEPLALSQAKAVWQSQVLRKKPFSFLALAWIDPPILFGQRTFFFDLLTGLGGQGILPKSWNTQFLKVSDEWLMSQHPNKVLFMSHDAKSTTLMKKQCAKWWPSDPSVCKSLPAEKFARASLTPLLHASELRDRLEISND